MYVCDHEFSLNGLWLHGVGVDQAAGRYRYGITVDGIEFGSSEAVISVVRRLSGDGSEVEYEGDDNGESSFLVMIRGDSLTALAEGEAALKLAFPRPGESVPLVWRPGGGAPAAVRTVLAGAFEFVSEDLDREAESLRRVFRVTLTHSPFVASEFETVVPSLPVGGPPVVEEIDDFASASAWSIHLERPSTSSASIVSGAVRALATGTTLRSQFFWTMKRDAPADLSALPYLVVEHRPVGAAVTNRGAAVSAFVPGGPRGPVELQRLSSELLADGWQRSVFYAPGTYASVTLSGYVSYSVSLLTVTMDVRRFDRSSTPTFGSRQALTRTLDIGGTERTTGALRFSGSGAPFPLGTVIVHTSPDLGDGYTPELMDGTLEYTTRTAGDNAPAGHWYANAVATTVPSARFAEASYVPVVWLSSANTQTVMVQIIVTSTASPSSSLYYAETIRTHVTFAAGEVKAVPLALVTLPGVRSRVGAVKFAVSVPDAVADSMKIGGLWAYRTGRDCALSIFTTDQPYAWLTPETLTGPQKVTVSDVDSIDAGWDPGAAAIQEVQSHILPAGRVLNHTVTGRVQDADVSYRFTQMWPANPADDGSPA